MRENNMKLVLIEDKDQNQDKEVNTVFSVGVISRVMENGDIPVSNLLAQKDFSVRPNAKINVGLGKL